MAKRTTIIDIGSNSIRMITIQRTSRFGFHIINETKTKVQIGKNSHKSNGILQQDAMDRGYFVLKSFLLIAKNLKSRKIITIATSALRDAPNKKDFLKKVSKELKLNIKIIDGKKEAYYGGIAILNLLSNEDSVTIDIGGGSCEFAVIKNKKVTDLYSFQIGTIRIKELFIDKGDYDGAKKYILNEIKDLNISSSILIGLGGSARAISKIILNNSNYPLEILHNFRYKISKEMGVVDTLIDTKTSKKLEEMGVKKDRFDTIGVGAFIFKTIVEHLNIKTIATSEVGIREGVFLCDLLRNQNHIFPPTFDVSLKTTIDRFAIDESQNRYIGANSMKLFDILKDRLNIEDKYRKIILHGSKLYLLSINMNCLDNEECKFYNILNNLQYNHTHQERILIAFLVKYCQKKSIKAKHIDRVQGTFARY